MLPTKPQELPARLQGPVQGLLARLLARLQGPSFRPPGLQPGFRGRKSSGGKARPEGQPARLQRLPAKYLGNPI